MFINLSKLFFFFTLFLGSMISISSSSLWGAWMGLEINLLSFIPIISSYKSSLFNEASIKYFIIQALASSMLLFFFVVMCMMMFNNTYFAHILISSSLFLKMGAAPFHFWFPEVMEGLSWLNSFILLTWQKFAPIIILSYLSMHASIFSMLVIIFSIFMGSVGGLNQTSLRKILAFSSINHIGWMLTALMINESLWALYFAVYASMNMIITIMFFKLNLNYLNQLFLSSFPIYNKISIFLMFFSFLGMPPLLGFIPKWFVIQSALFSFSLPIMIFMLMMSALTLYFYLRLMFSALLLTYPEMKPNLIYYHNPMMNFILNASMMINMVGILITSILLTFY
uniref:NADH-ubiquinone oxidoreductase chain 2 n=2 Tax=Tridactylidae TaxID=58551 RepID=A0A1J0M4K1_9ORTH|nr:NADH dehydrogenase subunit 2 [Xya japonica]APD14934.1 NADH dehydrogenase subunit 2 [Tridactylus sp. NS-2016]